jgi:PGF-CTERM protein
MNWKALVVAVTLVVSAVGTPAAAATANTGQQTSGQVQSGTYVSFEATDDAVVDYTVNGNTVVEGMSVQSASEARSESGGGLGLGGSVFAGAGLSVASSFSADASTTATIQAESGAEIEAHDNDRGIVVIRSNGESHVARFNGTDDSEAEQASEKRAVITNDDDGATASVIVVGDGNVTVSDGGNVTAMAEEDSRVVYRQYEGERSDSEKQQERMIANGTAVAEVYVQAAGDAASEAGDDSDETATATPTEAPSEEAEERSADVVRYSEDTTVEVTEQSANTFNATVERTESEGKVVIMSVSEAAFESAESAEDLEVYVDGEAAAQAESYSAVKAATQGGESSKYLVRSSSSAQASADVVVGINHFSERQLSMQSDDDGGGDATPTDGDGSDDGDDATPTDGDGSDDGDDATPTDGDDGSDDGGGTESGGQPGFGAAVAVVALAGAALLARRQAS